VVASPRACVAASKSASVQPPPARATRRATSTSTVFIGEQSMTRPPSQVALPAKPCPPPRTAIGRPPARATSSARVTSVASAQRTTAAGRRSWSAFQTARASS
jgi:hypothetical protein